MTITTLDGVLYANMVRGGAAELYRNRSVVNDLNVFPIPDGDTGDNMYMTIHAGADNLKDTSDTLCQSAAIAAKGMLLGARGNSGVILSRIFAGIAAGLAECKTVDLPRFSFAMGRGVEESYRAVSTPVEGTILTVFRDAVQYCAERVDRMEDFGSYFDELIGELRRSLDRTPDLLAVLKEAGVVDSGGAGFVFIAEGMRKALRGEAEEAEDVLPSAAHTVDISSFTPDSEMQFGYCTEFLLGLQNSKVGSVDTFDEKPLIAWLTAVGESVVAFREGHIVKVHVHTMDPGMILTECRKYGEFLTLKIENMMLQHSETTIENRFESTENAGWKSNHKKYATVAVAAGKGIQKSFADIGADAVVDGGQSMNPSAQDFVKAFDTLDAETVFVFPNNGNVVLTARQAASLYEKAQVIVIPTKTVGEGYAALSMMDTSSGDAEAIASALTEIAEGVTTGMVSRANRTTEKDGVNIVSGDFIGFADDVIYVDSPSRAETLLLLAEKLHVERFDVALLLCGSDVSSEEAEEVYAALSKRYRNTEIISIDGGQPIFDYILVLE